MDTSRPLNINELETTSYRKITEAALKYLAGEWVTNTHADGLESDSVEWNDAKSTDSFVTENKHYSGDVACGVSDVDISALKDNPFVSHNLPSYSTLQFAHDFKKRYGYHTSANGIANSAVGGGYASNYGVACMQPSGGLEGMLGIYNNTAEGWKCTDLPSVSGMDGTAACDVGTSVDLGVAAVADVGVGASHGMPVGDVCRQDQSQGQLLNLATFGAAHSSSFLPATHLGDADLPSCTLLDNCNDLLPNLAFSDDLLASSGVNCDVNCQLGSCATANGSATARVACNSSRLPTSILGTFPNCCTCTCNPRHDYNDDEATLDAIEMLSKTIDEKLTMVEERLSNFKGGSVANDQHLPNGHTLDASRNDNTDFACPCTCHDQRCRCNSATPRVEPINMLHEEQQQGLLASARGLPLLRLHEQQDIHLSLGKACDLDLRDSKSDFNFSAMQGDYEEDNASSDDESSSFDVGLANNEDVTCTTYVSNLNLADVGIDDFDKLESFEPGDNVTSTPDCIFSPTRELSEIGNSGGGGGTRRRKREGVLSDAGVLKDLNGNVAAGLRQEVDEGLVEGGLGLQGNVAAGLGQKGGATSFEKDSDCSSLDSEYDRDPVGGDDSDSDYQHRHLGRQYYNKRQGSKVTLGPAPTRAAAAARVAALDYGKIEQSWIIMMRCNEWLAKKCQRLRSMQNQHHMLTSANHVEDDE